MPLGNTPELDRFFEQMSSEIQQFRQDQEGIWALVNSAYLTAKKVLNVAQISPDLRTLDVHRVMMWATMLDYQIDSFFLILRRRLDAGIALLRLASELARDVARVGQDDSKIEIWLSRSDKNFRNRYRKEFKFDDTDPTESYLHELCDLASTFGVHGHMTTTIAMRPIHSSQDGSLQVLGVPDLEVFKSLEVWLAAFYPMEVICVRSFSSLPDPRLKEGILLFMESWRVFDAAFEVYRNSLVEMKADVLSSLH